MQVHNVNLQGFGLIYKPLDQLPHHLSHSGIVNADHPFLKGGWYLVVSNMPESKLNPGEPATMRECHKALKQAEKAGVFEPFAINYVYKTFSLNDAKLAMESLNGCPVGGFRANPKPRGKASDFLALSRNELNDL